MEHENFKKRKAMMDSRRIENEYGQGVSRRGFLKMSAAACAVAATPPMLVGCQSKTVTLSLK
jgi:hypothetical protein